jgi:hypothetical protein
MTTPDAQPVPPDGPAPTPVRDEIVVPAPLARAIVDAAGRVPPIPASVDEAIAEQAARALARSRDARTHAASSRSRRPLISPRFGLAFASAASVAIVAGVAWTLWPAPVIAPHYGSTGPTLAGATSAAGTERESNFDTRQIAANFGALQRSLGASQSTIALLEPDDTLLAVAEFNPAPDEPHPAATPTEFSDSPPPVASPARSEARDASDASDASARADMSKPRGPGGAAPAAGSVGASNAVDPPERAAPVAQPPPEAPRQPPAPTALDALRAVTPPASPAPPTPLTPDPHSGTPPAEPPPAPAATPAPVPQTPTAPGAPSSAPRPAGGGGGGLGGRGTPGTSEGGAGGSGGTRGAGNATGESSTGGLRQADQDAAPSPDDTLARTILAQAVRLDTPTSKARLAHEEKAVSPPDTSGSAGTTGSTPASGRAREAVESSTLIAPPNDAPPQRSWTLDIIIDPLGAQMAAFQVELAFGADDARIERVERLDAPAEAPNAEPMSKHRASSSLLALQAHDPAALGTSRVVIAGIRPTPDAAQARSFSALAAESARIDGLLRGPRQEPAFTTSALRVARVTLTSSATDPAALGATLRLVVVANPQAQPINARAALVAPSRPN